MYPSIGKKIRKYRKERGMTQEELAEKLDLSINYVGALERAEKNLTVTNLINIANVLGVTADMLLCDEIRIGYKIKSSMITEKIEKRSLFHVFPLFCSASDLSVVQCKTLLPLRLLFRRQGPGARLQG